MELDYDRLDPELRAIYEQAPIAIGEVTNENIAAIRAALASQRPEPPAGALVPERLEVPGPAADVPVYVYRRDASSVQPVLVWIHGGGYILGSAEDDRARDIAEALDCAVFSVDYRLAPEHPFPAGPEDCLAVLDWVVANADSLNVDTARIAMGGASAGGGMTAGTVLMNRDRGGPELCFQLLIYPMIDNLHDTPSGQYVNHPVWNRPLSFTAWEMYLGGTPGTSASPHAAATRATDLTGLPPAYVCVGSEDLFCDEDIDYARRLTASGIPCELAVFPGMFHGADSFIPHARLSQRLRNSFIAALKDALGI